MINKDTILSVYTDKQTLLEYLTKIETALDKAVLTSSQLVYEGGNNYHFKFVFEDGSSIETPSITLVQPISKVDFLANGNSVHFVFTLMDGETITTQTINLLKPVTAAAVRDGILYLTLSDGTEVSAGSITASFGASTFNGDVLVKGNLSVDGYMQQNSWQTDGSLNFNLSSKGSAAGLSVFYQHERTSNGKLNIVLAITKPSGSAAVNDLLGGGVFSIPSEIGAKLYPQKGKCLSAVVMDSFRIDDNGGYAGNTPVGSYLSCIVEKDSDTQLGITINGNLKENNAENDNNVWRFEFNFILS